MPAKTLPSVTDQNRDLGKQIGCMNNIFQLFDRHHFLTGWRTSSHNHKRLLLGAQHQMEPHNATKAVIEKDLKVVKEKPRVSTESSQASNSSSSCSSTFSSLDYNRTAQPEILSLRQINVSESPFQVTAMKEQQPSLTKGLQFPDIRDVVKDSMYREARGVSIKSLANDERKVTVMKYIDSPRPLPQSNFGKPKAYEGSTCFFAKVQDGTKNSKDERLTLPRFSYDGRESRDTFKTTMKLNELPRLSLDSKASSMKCSALESRLNFLGRDLHLENENCRQVFPLNQEPGSHTRSSSIVAKLMGLDALPDTISTDESKITKIKSSPSPRVAFLSKSSTTTEKSKQKQVSFSPPVSQKYPTSSSPRLHNANPVTKPTTCSRLPMEPAPWKQRDSSQGSPKMAAQSRKSPTNTPNPSSVYAEIEKRITELEFKRSGKDLRALKQILDAMQKTRERLENQRGESAELTMQKRCSLEDGCSNKDSNGSMWQNRNTYQHAMIIKGTCPPKQLGSSIGRTKSAKVMEKVKISSSTKVPIMETMHLQSLQTQDPKYHRENPARREKAKDLTSRNYNMKEPSRHFSSIDKKTTWRNLELEQTLRAPQRMRVENCTTSGRGFGMVSPRSQQNVLRIEREESKRKHSSKKVREKCSQNRKHKAQSTDLQLSDDQLSELSSETRYSSYQGDTVSVKSESNNSVASHIETEVISLADSINTNSREQQNSVSTSKEHMPAVELAVTMMEQPSPVSVLDTTFYSEDSPSPVRKISTAFRDERPRPDEAEWYLENLNHFADCTQSDPGYKDNQKSQNTLHLVNEPRLLKTGPNETAANHNEYIYGSLNPDHRYINKILLASGLLKDTSINPTAFLSSCHLINPDMFHALEETEDPMEEANGDLIEKNDWMKLNKKIQRRIVFDMVNEMLVRKISSGGLFTLGRKRMTAQGLMKELYLEMDHLRRLPYCNLDNGEDGTIRLLTADMKYESDDWTDYSGEVPALVFDIERLIFKDLINEVVTGEVVGLQDWPKKHCRQLFTK
ncbi:hypothetical protein Pfo_019538 [Paulownia fortunei]|nr:hypothetical protein Pfo_019538 [Paulownia fortunei]